VVVAKTMFAREWIYIVVRYLTRKVFVKQLVLMKLAMKMKTVHQGNVVVDQTGARKISIRA
jgi:hypothetical protein